jgi:EAL domain-containing protein (putative c-di-GMP-specific phosphodiesterase class I)
VDRSTRQPQSSRRLVTAPRDDWPSALERVVSEPGAIRPVFQPIVDLRRGVVCGYEMLARFAGPPERTPDVWFREAARHGRKVELEATMALAGIEARAALPPNCFLTINLDPASLGEPPIQEVLTRPTGLHNLIVELTEHTPAEDESLGLVLAMLRERGAMFAIDDVGSGYSGLARISALRPEFVKIDRALVAGLHREPAAREMVEMLGAVANRIDAWVVAEGIEEQGELEALMAIGVPLGQGYRLARPERAMVGPELPLSAWIRGNGPERRRWRGSLDERLWSRLPPLTHEDWMREAEARFAADPGLTHLPVVRRDGRPAGLIERGRFLRGEARLEPPLCALAGENPARLAQRALARAAESRLEPVLCCDEQGRYLGPISIETLTEALARRLLAAERD